MTSYYLEKKLYDFNCDIAQSFGVYNNDIEEEIAKYASSINIAAGFHAGDPVKIRKAFLFAKENNKPSAVRRLPHGTAHPSPCNGRPQAA